MKSEDFGGHGSAVHFAHANSYPPGSYRRMFMPIQATHQVKAIRFRQLWQPLGEHPKMGGWEVLANDVIELIESELEPPVHAFGHSMGATATLFAAARRPGLFKSLALIDPVFLPAKYVLPVRLTPRRWKDRLGMIRKALSRPHRWANRQAAFDFHRKARAFAGISDEVMWDYINAGTVETPDGGVTLTCPGAWEAEIYGSVPYVWFELGKCEVPALGVRGENSTTIGPDGWARWQRIHPDHEFLEVPDAGHMVPLQKPEIVGQAIARFFQQHDR